mmetsp:Transcript_5412/g.19793  ORF Transcript_5412/g.19793 Transcript_5412/m.19793 type:complete len:200 (-) Transcript_5412:1856-2455(-)
MSRLAEGFRALFTKGTRRTLTWDWHLVQFTLALIPPAVLQLWLWSDDSYIQEKQKTKDESKRVTQKNLEGFRGRVKEAFDDTLVRIEGLEEELQATRQLLQQQVEAQQRQQEHLERILNDRSQHGGIALGFRGWLGLGKHAQKPSEQSPTEEERPSLQQEQQQPQRGETDGTRRPRGPPLLSPMPSEKERPTSKRRIND